MVSAMKDICRGANPTNAAYIVHACNSLPRLEADLAELRALQVNGFDPLAAARTYPQLVADRARLIAALQKTNELVARGHVEGAYNAIAAGPQYAERVMAATASLLRELGEG